MNRALFRLGVVIGFTTLTIPTRGDQVAKMSEPVHLAVPQVSTLKSAATSVAVRVKTLSAQLGALDREFNFDLAKNLLSETLFDGEQEVRNTQYSFQKLASSDRQLQASQIFFGDILTRYSANRERTRAVDANSYHAVRDETLRLLDYNYAAYTTVATQESLTFDLGVNSSPRNAAVSFRRQGDVEYRPESSVTDTEIKNLVYAIWFVRVELDGYLTQEKQHDASRDAHHVVSFDLIPKP